MFARETIHITVLQVVIQRIERMYETPIDLRGDIEWQTRYKELLDQERMLLDIQRMSAQKQISA